MRVAIMREVSDAISSCELTHVDRSPVDLDCARSQHEACHNLLELHGWSTVMLPASSDQPDCVFIEDTAVVLDDFAIICRPGALSRRAEVQTVETALAEFLPLDHIKPPGTIDGGDVLVMGRDICIGRTARTNDAGISQFTSIAERHGYRVQILEPRGCLHLKTGVCAAGDATLLANPEWINTSSLGREVISVDPTEPFAANVLDLGDCVLVPEHHPKMAASLRAIDITVVTLPADELAKAEGGLTCCSLLVRG